MDGNIFANIDFLERAPRPDEKRITREEFKTAVRAVIEDMAKDDKLEGMAAFVVPLTGMMFADKMEEKLFGKEEA